jgi:hypothetical protein
MEKTTSPAHSKTPLDLKNDCHLRLWEISIQFQSFATLLKAYTFHEARNELAGLGLSMEKLALEIEKVNQELGSLP